MNSQLIIVDGHSSVGKSSVSKSIFKQISRVTEAYWLHEECENHPIRHGEFSFGALDTTEGMQANLTGMLQKWEAFKESIKTSGKVCITEGCLLHAFDRYFIHTIWTEAEIRSYYDQVIDVLRELNPVIVFLYRPDLRASLEKAFIARGDWWRRLILKRDDKHVYFKDHTYVDDDSMFAAVLFEQTRMMELFDGLQCAKIKIDTSGEDWEGYDRQILTYLGLDFARMDAHACDLRQYTGTYRWRDGEGEDDWIIGYDEANQCLFVTLFWPYMPMRCTADGVFEMISFPVEMRFVKDGDRLQFSVHGNYEWEYNEQVFVRV